VSRPQVIDDQEHERVHERVAAIDVAKDTGMVCTRTPHPARPGARRATVWTVKARMGAVRALGRQLHKDGIEVVTLESAIGLLAHLVLRPGDVRAGGAAGPRGPG
jgi:transposase